MRRLVLLLLCCVLLCSPVLAANEATSVQSQTTVRSDGSCQVTLTVTIRMETAAENLEFPLPGDASGITLNGAPVRALREGDVRMVDLRSVLGGGPWENTLTFRYTLDSAVSMDGEGRAMLEIPILCGFAFPVEQLEFSVILPGEVPFRPAFSSGYHQESIESSMTWSMDGNRLAGSVTEELLDRETLSMTLELPPELVPGVAATDENNPLFFLAALGCTVLAFLYWLIFLRSAPLRRVHRTTPPEGMTAGEVCSRLTGVGADLSLMVVSWAELGYLYIDRDDSGRIFLRKRMGMGNERSAFENHCFRMLFRKRRYVDGTGYHYAQLCRKIREDGANVKGQYLRGSGNPKLFRLLCCGVGAAAGAAMGIHLGGSTIWRMVLAAALGLLCAMASWQIQRACRFFRLGRKPAMPVGLICGGSMVLLALLTHTLGLTVLSLLVQLLGGLGAAYGGRRTPAARQRAGELLGLRHYMKTVSRQELQRVLKTNPDYYYALAPYALALGVDRAFARQLGNERLPNCPYLITGVYAATAMRWYPQLRDAADTLDAQQKRMKRQHFLKF